jgi:hypothetical protein
MSFINLEDGPTASELSKYLPNKPVHEYLRQLYRRGLLERKPIVTEYDRAVFSYKVVTL